MTITTQEAVEPAQAGSVRPLGPAAQGPAGPSGVIARSVGRAAAVNATRASGDLRNVTPPPSVMRTGMSVNRISRHHSCMVDPALSHGVPRPAAWCGRMRPASPTARPGSADLHR